jgi:hypothetical protein
MHAWERVPVESVAEHRAGGFTRRRDESDHRASLEERVSWTTGFTKPADKVVLGALAFFADFESGRNARPGMRRLVARADLPKRTVERSLQRLIAEGWITVTSTRHLGYTTYAIAT